MTVADRVWEALGDARTERVMVAASGGIDSTVLLHTLHGLGVDIVAAHVDHGLRPDSATDGDFVEALAAELGVPCVRLGVKVGEGNVQARARDARYAALAEAARDTGCSVVATGHTATDQAETVLLALARGAGLRGLAGMPAERALGEGVRLIRPLLRSTTAEVEAQADRQGWAWREDPSNATEVYARNRVRHLVLPALRAVPGGAVDRRIAGSADAARAALGAVRAHLGAATVGAGRLDVDALRALDPGLRDAVLAEAVAETLPDADRSRALVARLAALLDAEVGARVESGAVRVWREPGVLRFDTDAAATLGRLDATPLDSVPDQFPADRFVEVVDADRLDGPVVVRTWRPGDRITPVGLSGSRPVADVLREGGVARADRERAPVVLVRGAVAWVVGHRLGAAVAVTETTRRAVRWSWREAPDAG